MERSTGPDILTRIQGPRRSRQGHANACVRPRERYFAAPALDLHAWVCPALRRHNLIKVAHVVQHSSSLIHLDAIRFEHLVSDLPRPTPLLILSTMQSPMLRFPSSTFRPTEVGQQRSRAFPYTFGVCKPSLPGSQDAKTLRHPSETGTGSGMLNVQLAPRLIVRVLIRAHKPPSHRARLKLSVMAPGQPCTPLGVALR